MQVKGQSSTPGTRPSLSDFSLSALSYSPLALLPSFPSSFPGLGALGVRPRRLSPGSGTGSCSGEGRRLGWGGVYRGGRPSSGEAADGYGAPAAAHPGPGFGPVATASVTPYSPRTGLPGPEWGTPATPPPSPPIPSRLTPQPESTRSSLR